MRSKGIISLIAGLAAAVVLVFTAGASVQSTGFISGYILNQNGSAHSGAYVHIHNNTTGANGSTSTGSGGGWAAVGTLGQSYSVYGRVYCFSQYWYTNTLTGTANHDFGNQYLPINC